MEQWLLVHHHRHGEDYVFYADFSDSKLSNEEIAEKLGLDYEGGENGKYEDEWLETMKVPDIEEVPNIRRQNV